MNTPSFTKNTLAFYLPSAPRTLASSLDVHRVKWLNRILPDANEQRDYARERCAIVITEAIGDAMEAADLSRSELAGRLGHHKSYVTRALSVRQNITIRTLSDLLWACGMEVESVTLAPVGEALLPRAEAERFLVETFVQSPQTSPLRSRLDMSGDDASAVLVATDYTLLAA